LNMVRLFEIHDCEMRKLAWIADSVIA
jgi:hypothetical protein